MKLLYAFRFLTIIPIPYSHNENLEETARSTFYYPVVGLFIGAILYGAAFLVSPLFSVSAAAALLLAFWVIITGALHLDGISDLADGLGGGKEREARLEIMKDSRIGAFGAIALVIFLLLKWSMIAEVLAGPLGEILILSPFLARLLVLLVIRMFPSARQDGIGVFFKQHISIRGLIFWLLACGTAVWLVFSFRGTRLGVLTETAAREAGALETGSADAILGAWGLGAAGITIAVMFLFSWLVSRRLGGLTGDVYGAVIEISELLFMLIMVTAVMIGFS